MSSVRLHAMVATVIFAVSANQPLAAAAQRDVLQQADLLATQGVTARMGTVRLPPGEAVPLHRHDGVEQIYVASGHVIIAVAGQPDRALGPGDTTQIARGVAHSVRATPDAAALLVASWVVDLGAPLAVPVDPSTGQQADIKQQ